MPVIVVVIAFAGSTRRSDPRTWIGFGGGLFVAASAASQRYWQLPGMHQCINGCPDWRDNVYRDHIALYGAWPGWQWSRTCPNRPLFVALFPRFGFASGVHVTYCTARNIYLWNRCRRVGSLFPFAMSLATLLVYRATILMTDVHSTANS